MLAMTSLFVFHGSAQQKQSSPSQTEEVVKVDTALVQTDVMVFDKRGSFVDGLKRDQFILKIDGKPREISFFEKILAGSPNEEAQLAAARGDALPANSSNAAPVPLDRGRTIFFFVDDLHVAAANMVHLRASLNRFIDREMRQNDEAAIISASGQVGFLQQLTDNKAVLRSAIEHLAPRRYLAHGLESPPMSEYQALLIDRSDQDVLDFFVEQLTRQMPGLPRATLEDMVRNRALQILQEAGAVTTNMLASLESLVRSTRELAGRKIVFLISDGFFIDTRNSDAGQRMRELTAAAARAGVVIYSIDARGLFSGAPEAGSAVPADPSGRLATATGGEITASQEGLNALARDTGGHPFFNRNELSVAISTALKESSVYYLLAWRPVTEEQRSSKFRRIEVSVTGRPELVVRFRRGFGAATSDSTARSKNKQAVDARKSPGEELRAALRAAFPRSALPVSVSLNFIDLAGRGPILATSIKIATSSLALESQGGPPSVTLDLAGLMLDQQGKVVSTFEKRLTIKSNSTAATSSAPESVFYNHYFASKPGLYQVRVAAVEEKQSRAGSAVQWIQIPDLAGKALTLSTLIVGEKRRESDSETNKRDQTKGQEPTVSDVRLNVDHHFPRSSHLRFLTFVYNAAGSDSPPSAQVAANRPAPQSMETASGSSSARTGSPDLAVQVQVFRDNEPVITNPLHKLDIAGISDLTRLPYAAEMELSTLQPGRYVLQVTVIDRIAKTSASQRFSFEVD